MINNLEGWRHRPAMQFVHSTKQSRRSCQHAGRCSPAWNGRSEVHAKSTWNDGRDSHQRWCPSQWSHTTKQRLIMSKAQPSRAALNLREQETHTKRVCQRDLSQRWDGMLVSLGKWANPAALWALISLYGEDHKQHIEGKESSQI